MKHKLLALILALTIVSWAQTTTQSAPSDSSAPSAEKAKCGCCDKMASGNAKDGKMSCQRHASKDGKETASCCGDEGCCAGKDAKNCMKNAKAGSCCKDCGKAKMASGCCGTDCKECSCKAKKEKTAKKCCEHAVRG